MSKKIIAVVGKTGSGKDTFCDLLEKNFNSFLSFRFSDPLSTTLGLFFDKIKKEDQQWLASSLRDRFGEDILMRAVSKRLERATEDIIVINGIRVREELELIKKQGGVVVCIALDTKTRWERVVKRNERGDDNVSYEKFLEIDKGRTEQQIEELSKIADIIVDNSGSIEKLEEECKKIVSKI